MVKLDKIYTRTGDNGWTGLADGSRCMKNDLRIDACGIVDETNATIGIVRLYTVDDRKFDTILAHIQNDLFDLGADLATLEKTCIVTGSALRMTDTQVKRLEAEIDNMNSGLEALTSFVLPGGTPAAACLHLARTTARRAERVMVALNQQEKLNPFALHYINRLSDFLFVSARFSNGKGGDILWIPGGNR